MTQYHFKHPIKDIYYVWDTDGYLETNSVRREVRIGEQTKLLTWLLEHKKVSTHDGLPFGYEGTERGINNVQQVKSNMLSRLLDLPNKEFRHFIINDRSESCYEWLPDVSTERENLQTKTEEESHDIESPQENEKNISPQEEIPDPSPPSEDSSNQFKPVKASRKPAALLVVCAVVLSAGLFWWSPWNKTEIQADKPAANQVTLSQALLPSLQAMDPRALTDTDILFPRGGAIFGTELLILARPHPNSTSVSLALNDRIQGTVPRSEGIPTASAFWFPEGDYLLYRLPIDQNQDHTGRVRLQLIWDQDDGTQIKSVSRDVRYLYPNELTELQQGIAMVNAQHQNRTVRIAEHARLYFQYRLYGRVIEIITEDTRDLEEPVLLTLLGEALEASALPEAAQRCYQRALEAQAEAELRAAALLGLARLAYYRSDTAKAAAYVQQAEQHNARGADLMFPETLGIEP